MISEDIIKDTYITGTLIKGVTKVRHLQEQAARSLLNEKTGRLFANLADRSFGLEGSDKRFSVSVRILNYLRFNEIRSDKNLRSKLVLYNRIVWGVLYGETLPALKYGLTQDIKNEITKELQEAGAQLSLKK